MLVYQRVFAHVFLLGVMARSSAVTRQGSGLCCRIGCDHSPPAESRGRGAVTSWDLGSLAGSHAGSHASVFPKCLFGRTRKYMEILQVKSVWWGGNWVNMITIDYISWPRCPCSSFRPTIFKFSTSCDVPGTWVKSATSCIPWGKGPHASQPLPLCLNFWCGKMLMRKWWDQHVRPLDLQIVNHVHACKTESVANANMLCTPAVFVTLLLL